VFETTIRHVGGLLSAYELSGQQHPALLDQARQLADKLIFAWDGESDIPYGAVDFGSNSPVKGVVRPACFFSLVVLQFFFFSDEHR
jgi:mannosyl-oligosaccharide alpha-1,2-mannosidase